MRPLMAGLAGSKIREVANAGLGRNDVLAFWFGESDQVTGDALRQVAAESLMRGETFYSHNLGLPELREALRRYTAALHGDPGEGRIAVTSAGVNSSGETWGNSSQDSGVDTRAPGRARIE